MIATLIIISVAVIIYLMIKKSQRKDIMPNFLLSENSKIIIPLFTLVSVICFIVVGTYNFTTWKDKSDHELELVKRTIDRTIQECHAVNDVQDSNIRMLEVSTIENSTTMVEIQTDIKWIRAYMENE